MRSWWGIQHALERRDWKCSIFGNFAVPQGVSLTVWAAFFLGYENR